MPIIKGQKLIAKYMNNFTQQKQKSIRQLEYSNKHILLSITRKNF